MKMFSNKKRFNGNHLISDSIDSGEAFSLVVWRLRTTNFWSAGQELLPPKAPVQSFPNTFSASTTLPPEQCACWTPLHLLAFQLLS